MGTPLLPWVTRFIGHQLQKGKHILSYKNSESLASGSSSGQISLFLQHAFDTDLSLVTNLSKCNTPHVVGIPEQAGLSLLPSKRSTSLMEPKLLLGRPSSRPFPAPEGEMPSQDASVITAPSSP